MRVEVIPGACLKYGGEYRTSHSGLFEMREDDVQALSHLVMQAEPDVEPDVEPDTGTDSDTDTDTDTHTDTDTDTDTKVDFLNPATDEPADLEPDWPAPKVELPTLKDLPSVTDPVLDILNDAGFETLQDLLSVEVVELVKIKGIGSRRARKLVKEAHESLGV